MNYSSTMPCIHGIFKSATLLRISGLLVIPGRKSRFLKVISNLCFYPIRASGASSISGIMRFKERWMGNTPDRRIRFKRRSI